MGQKLKCCGDSRQMSENWPVLNIYGLAWGYFCMLFKETVLLLSMKKSSLALLFWLLGLTAVFAQNYKMHSVFIYSFTRYVQWPDAYNGGDFEILVLGDSPIIEELKTMAQSKKVGDRSITVTRIKSASDIRKCNILFVAASRADDITEVMEVINQQSILVVTESEGLGAKGSDINFVVKDGKLAFELNQLSINKQGLRVSNELTRLAILI
jgi:hypothetical protein